jgi:hypothetical protein
VFSFAFAAFSWLRLAVSIFLPQRINGKTSGNASLFRRRTAAEAGFADFSRMG